MIVWIYSQVLALELELYSNCKPDTFHTYLNRHESALYGRLHLFDKQQTIQIKTLMTKNSSYLLYFDERKIKPQI